MQKILIGIGIILILLGLAWPWLQRIGIGHLPGDIIVKRDNFTFYFPIMTSIIASILLSLLFWFLHK